MNALGLLGGTYDPVHHGHLRAAVELRERLQLAAVHLIPCGTPPHRPPPLASGQQRLAMLRSAIAGEDGLVADDRELRRPGPSYSIDTLRELRAEHGSRPLCLALGSDAFVGLAGWHRWQELFDLAHIIVWHRPHWDLQTVWQTLHPDLQQQVSRRQVQDSRGLHQQQAGAIHFLPMPDLDISSSRVRALVAARQSIRYLVPESIRSEILHIYRSIA